MASNQATIIITARDDAKGVIDGIGRSLGTLKGGAEDAGRGVGILGGALDGLRPHLSTIAGITLAVTALHAALGLLGNVAGFLKDSFLGINQQLDSSRVAFVGMLGSGQAATAMLQTLQTLAAQTPFEFPQLVTATQHLMSFGFSAGQVIPLLKDIGNASSYFGTGAEGINRMVLAIGQMHAGVVLHTQDLDQLIQVGVPVWDILAQGTGKNTAELQKMVANGQIASDTFLTYFDQWVQKTPGVADAMQKQSTTFAGAMSTIHDNATMAIATGLRPLFDLITEGANVVARFTEGNRFQEWVQLVSEGARRAADDIRALFAAWKAGGIDGALDGLKAKVMGFFDSFTGENAHTGGFNFIVTFAQGMYDAAQSVLSTVVSDIAQSIGDFFIGHSPPPKGPLSGILEGGAKTMQAFLDGMRSAVEGGKVSEIGGRVFATLNEALTGGSANIDFSALTDAIRSGALSMDELKVAGEGVDDVVRRIGESITDLQDKQDTLKGQIEDIQFSYADQIDPLQKQLDAITSIVDWTTKRRDLELEIAQNKIEQSEAGDTTLQGLNKTLSGLESQQRAGRTAPVDRTLENQIAGLQSRERGLPTGQAGAAQRKQIEDQIAGLRERQRVEKDGDTDAARALQARIDGVKQEVADRKAGYQTQLDSVKSEKDSVDLKAKGLELQRQLQALPLQEKIDGLKRAEKDQIDPLQRQYDLLDRQRTLLERQKQHWSEIGQEIKDALLPLQQAVDAQAKADAASKKAAGPKTPALPGGGLLGIKPEPVATGGRGADFATEATRGLAGAQFDQIGARIGAGITNGALAFIREHFASLIGSAIGGAVGGAVLGPVGVLIGSLLGGRIGTALQERLGGLPWQQLFGDVRAKVAPVVDAVSGAFDRLADAFRQGGFRGAATEALGEITGGLTRLLAWVGENAPKLGTALVGWGERFVDFVTPYIGPMLEAAGGLALRLYGWIVATAPGVRDKLLTWADEFVHWIAPKVPGMLVELGKLWVAQEKFMLETALKIGELLLKWGVEFVEWVAPQVPPLLGELAKLAVAGFQWVRERTPDWVRELGAWGKEMFAWVLPQVPPLLATLGELATQAFTWVVAQIPGLTVRLAGWAGEFIAWVLTVWPQMLVKLAELELSIGQWIVTDAAPAIGRAIKEWGPKFLSFAVDLLNPTNPDGILQTMAKIEVAILKWIADFATTTLPQAAAAFVTPFVQPFEEIGKRVGGFLDGLKRAVNSVSQAIAGKDIIGGTFPPIVVDTSAPAITPGGGQGKGGMPALSGWEKHRGKEGNIIDEDGHLTGRGDFPDVAGFVRSVGSDIGKGWDVLSGAVKDGGGALLEAALSKFGVSLDLPAGFADFGKGLASKLISEAKDSIGDLAKKLFAGAGGNNDAVRVALSMLSGDGAAWDGWCQRFVDNVRQALGFGRSGAGTARDHALALIASGQMRPGFGPPGSAQYWTGLPDGHVDVNGPVPGMAISTGPWGIQVVPQSDFASGSAGWAPIQLATGGIVTAPTNAIIGERGPEAVIPLSGAGRTGIGIISDLIDAGGRVVTTFKGTAADGYTLARSFRTIAPAVDANTRQYSGLFDAGGRAITTFKGTAASGAILGVSLDTLAPKVDDNFKRFSGLYDSNGKAITSLDGLTTSAGAAGTTMGQVAGQNSVFLATMNALIANANAAALTYANGVAHSTPAAHTSPGTSDLFGPDGKAITTFKGKMQHGGVTTEEGPYYLHANEAVIPLDSPRGRAITGGDTHVHIHVAGSVVAERDLVRAVQRGLQETGRRNVTTGIT